MKKAIGTLLIFFVFSGFGIQAQIEVGEATLPDVGDVLRYASFSPDDTMSHRESGADLFWSYRVMTVDSLDEEAYLDIAGTPLADSFPEANMLVEGLGSQTAARRNTNSIEILGFDGGPLGAFAGGVIRFTDPFEYRRVPINYGDRLSDEVSFSIRITSDFIPGIDTLVPIPGAMIDSLRFVVTIKRTEEATAWGRIDAQSQVFDVLKVKQEDEVENAIELGLLVAGNRIWFDVTGLIGGGFGGTNLTTTYKFLRADAKASVIEFEEREVPIDTMGNTRTVVIGRIDQSLVTSVEDLPEVSGLTVSPNPVMDRILLEADDVLENARWKIFNMDGRLIESGMMKDGSIEVNQLPKATYIIEVRTEEAFSVRRFVKQ